MEINVINMVTIAPKGVFTARLWQSMAVVYQEILKCNFVQELSAGTLRMESFAHYLAQDVLYLKQDNEALKTLSDRSENKTYADFFRKLANDGIEVEEIMHDEYFSYFRVKEATSQSPAFGAYGKYILECARLSPYPVAAAAFLPCFWLYAEVGFKIAANTVANNLYHKFIDTYSGDEYTGYIIQYLEIIEELAQSATQEMRRLMQEAFVKATRFELAVFDEAVHGDWRTK